MFYKLKKFFKKINSGYFYNLDRDTLINYLKEQVRFADEHNLEAVEELNIYYNEKKHKLIIWDSTKSQFKEEQELGLSVQLDDKEYYSVDNLFKIGILDGKFLSEIKYFKIELINCDSVVLNEYKKNHPELTDEFVNKINNYIKY